MLNPIADGVLVHESSFLQSNTVAVRGPSGVLLVDPGLTTVELMSIADDLHRLALPVVAGFSTHPDWDHVLWHERFGEVPRYGTTLGAAAIREVLTAPDLRERVRAALPPELADDIPIELFGRITGLPEGAARVPWDGPEVRIIEHRGHAVGHAALLLTGHRVLVAGDMLSDVLVPFVDLDADDPIGDYLDGLRRLEAVAGSVDALVPGHGSVARRDEVRARIALDRAYVEALRDGIAPDDPRIGPGAPVDWLADVHEWQAARLAERGRPRTGR